MTVVLVVVLLTVNAFVRVAVPPPGAGLVTETLRAPIVAPDPIVIFAVRLVLLFTVTVLTVMFVPKLTVVTPLMKFVPVKVTSSVSDKFPLVGDILVSVGARLLMLNAELVADVKPALLAWSV